MKSPSPFPSQPEIKIRPFWGSDMDQVLSIDIASFDNPWGRREFAAALQGRGVSMLCAHQGTQVVGYIVLQEWPQHFTIWNLAVQPAQRRRGIGKRLVDRAKCLAMGRGRDKLSAEVREQDLASQLFFKEQGFRAVQLVSANCIADPAICFEFHRQASGEDVLKSILEGEGRVVRREQA